MSEKEILNVWKTSRDMYSLAKALRTFIQKHELVQKHEIKVRVYYCHRRYEYFAIILRKRSCSKTICWSLEALMHEIKDMGLKDAFDFITRNAVCHLMELFKEETL